MRDIERLTSAVNMGIHRRKVDLPDGSEFVFYMTPLTLAERAKAKEASTSSDGNDIALQLLVKKACDENGERCFTPGDVATLRNQLPSDVVEALLMQVLTYEPGAAVDPKQSSSSSRKTAS